MTWDGIPEHRGLGRDGDDVPDLSGPAAAARFLQNVQRQNAANAQAAETRRRFLADLAARRAEAARQAPADMPPDPFSGGAVGAVAQTEMFHSLVEGGMTEPQALYYLACLVQVGLAMQLGRFDGELPPWPGQDPT